MVQRECYRAVCHWHDFQNRKTPIMITTAQIIDKFCSGPALSGMTPEQLGECRECATLQDLMVTVSRWMDFDNSAQAARFVIEYLDWDLDD
jgi:hypothetical protein